MARKLNKAWRLSRAERKIRKLDLDFHSVLLNPYRRKSRLVGEGADHVDKHHH